MTSLIGRTGIPRDAIASINVLKSDWLISSAAAALPTTILCRHRMSQSPEPLVRSSIPPEAVTDATVVPAEEMPVLARILCGIVGGKFSFVSEMMVRDVDQISAAIAST